MEGTRITTEAPGLAPDTMSESNGPRRKSHTSKSNPRDGRTGGTSARKFSGHEGILRSFGASFDDFKPTFRERCGELHFNLESARFEVDSIRYHPTPTINLSLVEALFRNTQGLIFVANSNDRDRVVEARDELHRMLNEDELRDVVLLVFTNKQDLPNAMNAAEITGKLGLHSLCERHWYIQSTCATSGEGLYVGLD
ncbi:hypothetical protein V6N11_040545 [Hibiscus sabdariffa]|uniref:ADP-ribosylation factor n=1 Tax=Hibiscus sabdariffa TaxID=183260 RepID=A0ABR2RHX8_9ROSI